MKYNHQTNYALQSQQIVNQMQKLKEYDEDTFWHSVRTARLAAQMGKSANLSINEITTLTTAALLHDIGKMYIPIEILNKNGKLTNEEFDIIKKHPTLSAEHLAKKGFNTIIQRIVYEHHENFDGTGYPNGKHYDQIHKLTSILRVADTFDAMQSKRVYKDQIPLSIIYQEFQHDNGHCYDPKIVQYL